MSGIFSAMPACRAASKSTSHCMPASTGEPGGNPVAGGVRLTASCGVIGPPRNIAVVVPITVTTVQASGSASVIAGLVHDAARVGGVG